MWSWLLHRITGVILVVGLLYHFILMHFMGHDNYSYEAVMQRLSESSWKIFNIVFSLFSLISRILWTQWSCNRVCERLSEKIFKNFFSYFTYSTCFFWGKNCIVLKNYLRYKYACRIYLERQNTRRNFGHR